MMKSSHKIIYTVIILVTIIMLITFIIDYLLAKNLKNPIFCRKTVQYWDGGSYECQAPLYKINVYSDIDGKIKSTEIGLFNLEFNKNKKS